MTTDAKRREVLASLGLRKAPELVAVRGQVAPGVAATLERLARESGLKSDEVVGLAVTDWTRRAERRPRAAPSQSAIPDSDGR